MRSCSSPSSDSETSLSVAAAARPERASSTALPTLPALAHRGTSRVRRTRRGVLPIAHSDSGGIGAVTSAQRDEPRWVGPKLGRLRLSVSVRVPASGRRALARADHAHPVDHAVALGEIGLLLDDHRPVGVATAEPEADLRAVGEGIGFDQGDLIHVDVMGEPRAQQDVEQALPIVCLPYAVGCQCAEVDLGVKDRCERVGVLCRERFDEAPAERTGGGRRLDIRGRRCRVRVAPPPPARRGWCSRAGSSA